MNILVLSPYPPYPPHGGGTMRIYQLLRGLSARHAVTCLSFAPDAAAEQALAPLRQVCHVQVVRGPPRRNTLQRAWTTAASPLPDMALRNASPAFRAALGELLARDRFDLVQAESIEMATYLEEIQNPTFNTQNLRFVLDQFNAEFVLQKRAALTSLRSALTSNPKAALHNLAGGTYSLAQWLKLARYERRAISCCDAVLAVSDDDRRTLERLAPQARAFVVPNGVDTIHFSRTALQAERAGALAFGGPALVFSGTLDFRPNVDAATWFAHEVLPLVRARRPDARLLLVGKRPAQALGRLAGDGVVVVGEVPDARPYIAGASVYVVPMRIGGGVRLKLLEALALEAPTVSTSMGAEGVSGLRHAEHCLLADDPASFASAVLRLLDDPGLGARLGVAGRALVQQHYDWSAIVPRLEAAYEELVVKRKA